MFGGENHFGWNLHSEAVKNGQFWLILVNLGEFEELLEYFSLGLGFLVKIVLNRVNSCQFG